MKKILSKTLKIFLLVSLLSFTTSPNHDEGIKKQLRKNSDVTGIKNDVSQLTEMLIADMRCITKIERIHFRASIIDAKDNESKFKEIFIKYLPNHDNVFQLTNGVFEKLEILQKNKKFQKLSMTAKNDFLNEILSVKNNIVNKKLLPVCSMGEYYGTAGCASYASSLLQQGYTQQYANFVFSTCALTVYLMVLECEETGVWPES